MRLKFRYTLCIIIILSSILITPWTIKNAYITRGYGAIGGEYLLIPFALVIVMVILAIAKDLDNYKIYKEIDIEEELSYDTKNHI